MQILQGMSVVCSHVVQNGRCYFVCWFVLVSISGGGSFSSA